MTVRVLIVDDQPIVRKGFRLFLSDVRGLHVVGEASSGAEAMQTVTATRPDVVFMDIRMPGENGLWASRRILEQNPSTRIIVMTTFDLDAYLFGALDLGASGFLLKDADPDELIRAVHIVANGGCVVSQSLVGRLVQEFSRRKRPFVASEPTEAPRHGLTAREVEVVMLLAQGCSNREIADELQLEVSTVKAHIGKVASKLGVTNRVQIVIWSFAAGLAVPRIAEMERR